ncbi:hypothetical protein BDY19DRAFT_964569 [Irpex rosettiformis]|uniref:Uncharacterized protein n=1 Tax=Irpex rosettiformis TaxID=378272 RepID=A0ACB8TUU9_9APHY|nr:hypothetical protein BDY19DRAFT_964569 [Irpex rosettiformis]
MATTGAATNAAQKILTLASTESLDMLRAVTAVFKESLDKADAWRQNLSSFTSLPPASSSPSPPEDSPSTYRESLPPIQLTPSSDGPAKDFDALSLSNAPAVSSARFSSTILRREIDNDGVGKDSGGERAGNGRCGGSQSMDVDT